MAAVIKNYYLPSIAVLKTSTLTMTIDGEQYFNGSTIDWGILDEANTTYIMTMNVTNIGAVPCTVTHSTTGMPVGWTQIWLGNGTVLAVDAWISADLELTTGLTDGNYSWTTYIHTETA